MQNAIIRLLITLICCLPTFALAATDYSIHAEWTGYSAPSGYTVTGFNLYQEGMLACQTQNPSATSLDCSVSLTADTTNFTLAASFSDGTESPHSEPFTFSPPSAPLPSPPPGDTFIQAEWTSYTPPSGMSVNGYNLYQEGALACQTQDKSATAMGCSVSLTADTTNFTLTAAFSDGTESPHSTPFALSISSVPTPAELKAVITTNGTLSGPAPLSVGFNASSSTGTITSYQWHFGDGSTATGNTVSHSYMSAGTYTAKLTVTNSSGQSNTASTSVTVTQPINTHPPTAVISSSTAAGQAPLAVSFNGSASTAALGTSITSYSWSFGDGFSATGASISHTFTTAGTYNATLTVTDSKGLTSSASTPIVVTPATNTTNKTPTAVANVTPISGTAPLTATFDGSASTDSDGTIASYIWNYGDGSSASGKTATHTYTTEGIFTATLQVTDNQGAKSTTSKTITVQAEQQTAELNIEVGEVLVTNNWVRVPFSSTFENPIVIAGPPSFNNSDPCVVRLRNIDTTGFDIKLNEWEYLDGTHIAETINYIVMEAGRTTLPNGSIIEAGSFSGTTRFNTVMFSDSFAKAPVVLTTIASMNDTEAISGRIKDIGLKSFAYYFREQESNKNRHSNETVNFIAWEPGTGTVGAIQFEASTTGNSVTDSWYQATFNGPFKQSPFRLADMQTTNGSDTSALRTQKVTTTGFQVKVEEEQSRNSEVSHTTETVGYLSLGLTGDK